jgi:hypothetical protein
MDDLTEARLAASEKDVREDRLRRGTAKELMATLATGD